MAFGSSDCQSHNRMFPCRSPPCRQSKSRRHFRSYWLRSSRNATITPETPHLKIPSNRSNVTSHAPCVCPYVIHRPRPNPQPNLPPATLASNFLLRFLRHPFLSDLDHVGDPALQLNMARQQAGEASSNVQRCKNWQGSFKTYPLVYDGVCSIAS